MPRIEAELDSELYQRLKVYIAKNQGLLYCQQSQVVAEAIKDYLDRHERRVSRG